MLGRQRKLLELMKSIIISHFFIHLWDECNSGLISDSLEGLFKNIFFDYIHWLSVPDVKFSFCIKDNSEIGILIVLPKISCRETV